MYNVYVTNKSEHVVYVRLKSQELSSLNTKFHQELHTLVSNGDTDESYVRAFLVRWGFRLIAPKKTLSFATRNVLWRVLVVREPASCTPLCIPHQNCGLWMKK